MENQPFSNRQSLYKLGELLFHLPRLVYLNKILPGIEFSFKLFRGTSSLTCTPIPPWQAGCSSRFGQFTGGKSYSQRHFSVDDFPNFPFWWEDSFPGGYGSYTSMHPVDKTTHYKHWRNSKSCLKAISRLPSWTMAADLTTKKWAWQSIPTTLAKYHEEMYTITWPDGIWVTNI